MTNATNARTAALEPYLADVPAAQRQTLWVLSSGLVLSGLGMGAAWSIGSLLIVSVTQSTFNAGLSSAMSTLGAAVFAIPLATLASRFGRRRALTTGALIAATGAFFVVFSAIIGNFPLLLISMLTLGAGNATSLQSRFSAGDLAAPKTRGRDISLVVWSMTIGTVIGPNLVGPGDVVGMAFGLPSLAGAFAFTLIAQVCAATMYFIFLRPDPLLLAKLNAERTGHTHDQLTTEEADDIPAVALPKESAWRIIRSRPVALIAVLSMAFANATMVVIMSMTPVHLAGMHVVVSLIGLTVSLHIAGMYALAPLFGWLSDRIGSIGVILIGQAMFIASLVLNWSMPEDMVSIVISLILLGTGWSAATVAGATMLTGVLDPAERPKVQGVSDTVMSFGGAMAGIAAGPLLTLVGFQNLNVAAGVMVLATLLMLSIVAWRKKNAASA